MKTIAVSDTTTVEEMIAAADDDDVVLLREGRPVALLTAFDDDDLDWYARERDPAFLESIARAATNPGRSNSQP
jgi:hypothetical protein